MIEAARTTASPMELWAIVVIAVSCLAFWLGMITVASADPGGARRRRRVADMQGPVVGGTHVSDGGRSVAPNRRAAAIFADHEAEVFFSAMVPGQRTGSPAGEPAPAAENQQHSAATPARAPAQRTGEADQPRRAGASSGDAAG